MTTSLSIALTASTTGQLVLISATRRPYMYSVEHFTLARPLWVARYLYKTVAQGRSIPCVRSCVQVHTGEGQVITPVVTGQVCPNLIGGLGCLLPCPSRGGFVSLPDYSRKGDASCDRPLQEAARTHAAKPPTARPPAAQESHANLRRPQHRPGPGQETSRRPETSRPLTTVDAYSSHWRRALTAAGLALRFARMRPPDGFDSVAVTGTKARAGVRSSSPSHVLAGRRSALSAAKHHWQALVHVATSLMILP